MVGIKNYLYDWLILAQPQGQLCKHRDSHLGLRVNWEKIKFSPVQSISFLRMELDLVKLTSRLSTKSVPSRCWTAWIHSRAGELFHLNSFRGSWGKWHLQLQSRYLSCFISDRFSVGFTTWDGHGTAVAVTVKTVLPPNLQPLFGPCFSMGRGSPSSRVQTCCLHRYLCHRLGRHVQRACSIWLQDKTSTAEAHHWLEVWLALCHFKSLLHDKHLLVQTDNTAAIAYINNQGPSVAYINNQGGLTERIPGDTGTGGSSRL